MIRSLLTSLLLVATTASADLVWTFDSPDSRPGNLGGVYGYVYPSAVSPGKTSHHVAGLSHSTAEGGVARLGFTLDGTQFPSAGFGLMFDDAAPIDLRGLDSITLRLRADRRRTVRLSLASTDPTLKAAADDGISFGRDSTIGTEWVRWTIHAEELSWPYWATRKPAATRDEILSSIFAVQFDLPCGTRNGSCSLDSGWLEVDDLHLYHVGGTWEAPPPGDCSGEALWIDRFSEAPARQNELGGWWYAYSDRSSSDSLAVGRSRILNAGNPDSATTWNGPDLQEEEAALRFALQRGAVWSGYAAIETQLAAPLAGVPQARSFPGARAISFRMSFDADFPDALGGVLVHLRKEGRDFAAGRDHQIRIPRTAEPREWCLDLSSFEQPSWAEWVVPFQPDSLVALSFEAKLPPSLNAATSGFRVGPIAFHGTKGSAVHGRAARSAWSVRTSASGWDLRRSAPSSRPVPWRLADPSGQILSSGLLASGSDLLRVPRRGAGLVVLQLLEPGRPESFRLLAP